MRGGRDMVVSMVVYTHQWRVWWYNPSCVALIDCVWTLACTQQPSRCHGKAGPPPQPVESRPPWPNRAPCAHPPHGQQPQGPFTAPTWPRRQNEVRRWWRPKAEPVAVAGPHPRWSERVRTSCQTEITFSPKPNVYDAGQTTLPQQVDTRRHAANDARAHASPPTSLPLL